MLCRFWIVSLLFGRSPILMIDSILLCLPPHHSIHPATVPLHFQGHRVGILTLWSTRLWVRTDRV